MRSASSNTQKWIPFRENNLRWYKVVLTKKQSIKILSQDLTSNVDTYATTGFDSDRINVGWDLCDSKGKPITCKKYSDKSYKCTGFKTASLKKGTYYIRFYGGKQRHYLGEGHTEYDNSKRIYKTGMVCTKDNDYQVARI